MTNPQLLITLILVQMGLLGVLWLGAAALGLVRRPAAHWGAANLMAAVALVLVALRSSGVSPWFSVVLANALGVVAYVVNRRGVQIFCTRQAPWREHAAVVVVAVALLVVAVALQAPGPVLVAITSLSLAYCLLRAGQDVLTGLHAEFGRGAALGCAAPMLLLGTAFALRGLLALVMPDQAARPVVAGGGFNTAVGLLVLVTVLLLNLGLGAMVVIRTVAQLRRLSDHDSLTGLLNRRGLSALHERERARMLRGNPGYAFLLIDLDHFKRVNDRHGHETGDALLVAVAQALLRAVRPVDGVARTGGEEFCVLLPGTSSAAAVAAAERLQQAVRRVAIDADGSLLSVTCSMGVTWTGDASEAMAVVARRADHAMYQAKADGRDRVVIASNALPSALAPQAANAAG